MSLINTFLRNYTACACFIFTSLTFGDGVCCINGGACNDTINEDTCLSFGSVWHTGESCETVTCETNCGGSCQPDEISDCDGNCVPIAWIGNGSCEDGTSTYNLNCVEFGYDNGDCTPPEDLPILPGACCLGDQTDCDEVKICENLLYESCLSAGGLFLGENTVCLDQTCSCPPGEIGDCNGNCFPLSYLDDGICHDGHSYPENGDDSHEYQLSLGCLELACDGGDCAGICSGACCLELSCLENMSIVSCADLGGTFLGGGENCNNVDCSDFVVPIKVTREVTGFGNYISGEFGARVAAANGVIAVALHNCLNIADGTPVSVVNVYTDNGSILSETLVEVTSSGGMPYVSTDGTRVVMAVGSEIISYVADKFGFVFEYSFTTADGDSVSSIDISGDRIVACSDWGDQVHIYERSGFEWAHSASVTPAHPSKKVAIEGNTIVVADLYKLQIYENLGSGWSLSHIESLMGEEQDISFDGDRIIIGETTDYYPGTASIGQARVFKRQESNWIQEATLIPVDTQPDDDYGRAVSIAGDIACVSGTKNDGAANDGGVVSVFRFINGSWKYVSKVFPADPRSHMHFGADVGTDGNSIVVGWAQQEDIWSTVYQGAQTAKFSDYEWMSPTGGYVDTATNWMPSLPNQSDTVGISIPATFPLLASGSMPFKHLAVGPSRPQLDLQNIDTTLGSSGSGSLEIKGTQSYTGSLRVEAGELTVSDSVTVGARFRPGILSIASTGSVVVNGDYFQSKSAQLSVVLTNRSGAALTVNGDISLDGTIALFCPQEDVDPEVGTTWTILSSGVVPEENVDKFSVAIMPGIGKSKYMKLDYIELNEGGFDLTARVESIAGLFDLEDGSTVSVGGRATDVVVADLGSVAGPPDGFDDIALAVNGTPGEVYIFLNDGSGGVGSQITYNSGNDPSGIDAGDIDMDGTLDLVVSNASDNTFFVLLNNGENAASMTVLAPVSTGDVPVDIKVMDIDDDLDSDIVVACFGVDGATNTDGSLYGQVEFYEVVQTTRPWTFSIAGLLRIPKPKDIDPGDVNNDKDLNVMIVSLNASNKVANIGQSAGIRGFNWIVIQELSVGSEPDSVALGDLDGDGDSDAIVANAGSNTLSVLITNDSSGVWDEEITVEVGDAPKSLSLLDYDGDGDLDLSVIATTDAGNRAVLVYRNDTSLNPGNSVTFALEQAFDEGQNPILLASGEMDGDDADDLVSILSVSGFRGSSDSVITLKSAPPAVDCVGDLDNSTVVDVLDLLIVIADWGTCTSDCQGDLNTDGTVDIEDLLMLIAAWGDCG